MLSGHLLFQMEAAMKYITVRQAAEKWCVTERWVQALLKRGSISGAARFGRAWMIPEDAGKPADGRVRNGRKAVQKNST